MKDLIQKNLDVKNFWKNTLVEIELSTNPTTYKQITAGAVPMKLEEGMFTIACENTFIRNNLLKEIDLIKGAIQKAHKQEYEVIIKIEKGVKGKAVEQTPQAGSLFDQVTNPVDKIKEKQQKSGINPKYTFENYIKGDNNQLAVAIAKTVANKPGEAYNPVFLYSGVGLGKTHLIQAIGNQIIKNQPGTKVIYTTGEQFMNELIDAIRNGDKKYATNNFRNKYRNVDVFLIDDIQIIIGKQQTQEEFFYTFNSLFMEEKQIVITSDRPPQEFNKLPDRITSRFQSGMIVDIQPPTFETRAAILRTKRDLNRDPISNEVIDFIAEKVSTNIRELEGAYIRVVSLAQANGEQITLKTAADILKININEPTTKQVNMNQILKAVCNHYSVKAVDIKGTRRTKDLVLPRQVAMYLIQNITKTPLMTIGDFLGGRDHTTILHGTQKIEKDIQEDRSFKQEIELVKKKVFEE